MNEHQVLELLIDAIEMEDWSLVEEAIKVIKEQPATTTGHIFNQVTNDRFKHYWVRAKIKAGIANFRFHDLRACAITNFFLPPYNFNIPMVAKINGPIVIPYFMSVQL